MNDGNTGYPWSQGDPLLAADLNAAIAAASSAIAAGGPFLSLATGGTVTGATTFGNTLSVTGQLNVGSTINLGTTVGASPSGTVTIQTPSGSNINLLPQGIGRVILGGGTKAPLDYGLGGQQSGTLNIGSLGVSSGTGFLQLMSVTGSAAPGVFIGMNQWNVNSDTAALTGGRPMFHTAINYNYGGAGFSGARGGLWVNMLQTGSVTGSSGSGGITAALFAATTTGSFGGTNPGTGAAGAVFGGNFSTRMASGTVNLLGTTSLELDVEADTGAVYQSLIGLSVVAINAHLQPGINLNNTAITVGAQSNSIGFDIGYGVTGWGLGSTSTLFQADYAYDRPTFTAKKGFDLRAITFSDDIFEASGFGVGPTGRVRVGTGYLDYNSAGAILNAAGAVCTGGTLTGPVATTYASDGNRYYADDPYGGMWLITFLTGTTSITNITSVATSVVSGTPPANPVTLTPKGALNRFVPGTIAANLTWDTSRTTLSLQPSGGATVFGGPTTFQNTLTLSKVPAAASLLANLGTMNYAFTGVQPYLANLSVNPAGTLPGSGAYGAFSLTIPNCTVDSSSNLNGYSGMLVNWQGGFNLAGGHTALNVLAKVAGAVTNIGTNGFIVGINSQLVGVQPITAGNANMIAFSPQTNILAGATGYALIEAIEAGVGSVTPLTGGRFGMTMFSLGTQQGNPNQGDVGITVAGTKNNTQFGVGYGIGRANSPWGVLSTGTIFGPLIQTNANGYIPQQAALGVNFGSVNFGTSGFAYVSPGFQVDTNGNVRSGDALLSTSGTTVSLDAVGYTGATATMSNPGASYVAGDQIYDTVCNGILSVDTVSAGNIATFHWIRAPHYFGATPPATLGLVGGNGNQLAVANVTWTQATTLSLQPSGGTVQVGSGCVAANDTVATVLGSVGPVGSHTTVQEWMAVKNASGTIRYIPCF